MNDDVLWFKITKMMILHRVVAMNIMGTGGVPTQPETGNKHALVTLFHQKYIRYHAALQKAHIYLLYL